MSMWSAALSIVPPAPKSTRYLPPPSCRRERQSPSLALRTSMATCGYESVKEFQKAEVMVAPALQTEGKVFQKAQGVGMGH